MNVRFQVSDLESIQLPMIVIGVIKESKDDKMINEIKNPLGEIIREVITLGDFTGKKGETSLI